MPLWRGTLPSFSPNQKYLVNPNCERAFVLLRNFYRKGVDHNKIKIKLFGSTLQNLTLI